MLTGAAPASLPITIPTYSADYDVGRDLAPVIQLCAMTIGQTDIRTQVLEEGHATPEQVRRVAEVCSTFNLGIAYALRQPPEEHPMPTGSDA